MIRRARPSAACAGFLLAAVIGAAAPGAAAAGDAPASVTWEGAAPVRRAEWELRLRRLAPASPGAGLPLVVRVAVDAERQAAEQGDAAFATWKVHRHRVELRISADIPEEPDLLSPALASARFLAAYPGAARNAVLAAAFGAHRAGTWWGRPSSSWAPLLREAGILPSPESLASPAGDSASPSLLEVGAAASALDAWARGEGERAVERAVGSGAAPLAILRRYLERASREPLPPTPARVLPAESLRGISFAMENSVEGSYLSRRSGETLARLQRDGANAVSVIPYAFQRSRDAPELRFPGRNPRGETEEGVLRAAQDAHRRGLAVLLKPQIWLWRGFTGDIAMANDADWSAWFRNYRRYLIRFAAVAEAGRAEMFDVGVELCATEKREREWRELIAAVRKATSAPLVYSCNWGKGAEAVPFWDTLDAIGVDFYDPLSAANHPTDAELADGVRSATLPLARVAARTKKPVYLSEVGFPSVAGAWVSPHDEASPRPYSASDPARCARAVFSALEDAPWFRGLFWWKAFSSGEEAAPGEKTFNVLGRPIEAAIREGFQKMRARESGKRPGI